MSIHADIAEEITLDERFNEVFERCLQTPPPKPPPTRMLTPEEVRAAVRKRAAGRPEDDPTVRRPTRPSKPVTPPARRAVLIRAPPATAAISRHYRTAGPPPPMARTTPPTGHRTPLTGSGHRIANPHATTVRQSDHQPLPALEISRPALQAAAITVDPPATTPGTAPSHTVQPKQHHQTAPTTTVTVPGGEILEISSHIIRDVRRYRAKVPNGHWVL
ncbi:extensin-like, partial [Pseudomyrmex gracilis]|uniref:extensin-like n=1 Tax=Pseudomyrmex gracilis TaxID=219809 RepID=UPI00099534F9